MRASAKGDRVGAILAEVELVWVRKNVLIPIAGAEHEEHPVLGHEINAAIAVILRNAAR